MHRVGIPILLALVCACGAATEPTPSPTVEPSTTTGAEPLVVAEPEPLPPTTVVAEPAPADVHIPVLSVPDDFVADDVAVFRTSVVTIRDPDEPEMELEAVSFVHPNAQARAALARFVESHVLAEASIANDFELRLRCAAHLANEHLVSALCTMAGEGGRFGYDYGVFAINVAIDGETLREVLPQQAVLPSVDLHALATEACLARAQASHEEQDGLSPEEYCATIAIAFGRSGFDVLAFGYPSHSIHARVPYAQLADQLLADGPLGPVLTTATRHDITMPAERLIDLELARDCMVRFDLQPLGPIASVLQTFDRLPDDPAVRGAWATDGTSGQLVSESCVTNHEALAHAEAAASARAALFGSTAIRGEGDSAGAVWRGRVTDALNLRSGPTTSAPISRTLAPGTDVVVATGTVDGQTSASGSRGRWLRVVAADDEGGWLAAALVRRVDECARPSFDALLARVPEASRAGARRDLVRGLVVSPTATRFVVMRAGARSWVAIGDESDCGMEEPSLVLEIEGRVEEVRFVPVQRGSTDAVVVLGALHGTPGDAGFDGVVTWSAFAPGATTAGWSSDAATHPSLAHPAHIAFGVQSGRDVWHVEIREARGRPHRVRWDGARFVESGGP